LAHGVDGGGPHLTLAGSWYHFVALPILQFFVLRWIWRVVIWTLFLAAVSRMQLNLMPTHTDMAGGLGFLGTAHVAMAILPFAASCVLSAEIAFQMTFEGLDLARLQAMAPLLIAYLVLVAVLTVGPLLVFVPAMARARLAALRTYGILVQRHNQQFHDKWIAGPGADAASPLGDGDMSSLVDLGSSYIVIRQMSVFPFSRSPLLQVMIVSCLPGLPLIFLVLPFAAVIRLLSGVIL
jgi:hypothetical protein